MESRFIPSPLVILHSSPIDKVGLLKHLLFWPVTGPQFLVNFSLDQVQGAVRQELTDDQSVKEDLMELQMRLELGEIDDDEYVVMEGELMERLRAVRRWREELGMGMAGGPVQVVRPDEIVEPSAPQPGLANRPDAPADDESPPSGGIASPDGASVEVSFDWES